MGETAAVKRANAEVKSTLAPGTPVVVAPELPLAVGQGAFDAGLGAGDFLAGRALLGANRFGQNPRFGVGFKGQTRAGFAAAPGQKAFGVVEIDIGATRKRPRLQFGAVVPQLHARRAPFAQSRAVGLRPFADEESALGQFVGRRQRAQIQGRLRVVVAHHVAADLQIFADLELPVEA